MLDVLEYLEARLHLLQTQGEIWAMLTLQKGRGQGLLHTYCSALENTQYYLEHLEMGEVTRVHEGCGEEA